MEPKQNEWEAGPNEELKIPSEYITGLKYEIIVLAEKKPFAFRCATYEMETQTYQWIFKNVIIDTSKKDDQCNVTLVRLTYHPEVALVNTPFMVIPAPEVE